jgi:1-acyl-sn-glycerol-3-phosphate acyltransferase
MRVLLSAFRVVAGMSVVIVAAILQLCIYVLLLPSRIARIRSSIIFARLVGKPLLWLIGYKLTVSGAEHLDPKRPAIYVVNHASLGDFFIATAIMPYGTVGVVKKQVVAYPFVGQVYMLSGHLRIDRGQHAEAVQSMKDLAALVRRAGLSIYLSPEGTRSRDGRLKSFKKGWVHLAIQTGLPIVPIIVHDAHKAWRPDSLDVHGGRVRVEVLPAEDTSSWSPDDTDAAVEQIHAIYRAHLGPDQLPLPDA